MIVCNVQLTKGPTIPDVFPFRLSISGIRAKAVHSRNAGKDNKTSVSCDQSVGLADASGVGGRAARKKTKQARDGEHLRGQMIFAINGRGSAKLKAT